MLFKTPALPPDVAELHAEIEELRRKLSYGTSSRLWSGVLARVMLARAIQGSNSIEGYNVTIDDAIAAADGEDPLDSNPELETWRAIIGYRDAMTYVLRLADDPHFELSTSLVRSLHFMLQKYDPKKHPGQWRPGPIYVRNDMTGETVYEGPNADLVPELMRELIVSLTDAASTSTPLLVRGAMAHLNLVMIHPFADGNGRMARCLQTLVLARGGILAPQFCSIEEYLGRFRDEYYAVLGEVGAGAWHPERDALPWVKFTLDIHHRQATTLLRRNRELAKLWAALEGLVEQLGLKERMLAPLANAALGFKLRNVAYRQQAEVTNSTASHDLRLLTEKGLLVGTGLNKARYYMASQMLRQLRESVREPDVTPPRATSLPATPAGQQVLPGFWDELA